MFIFNYLVPPLECHLIKGWDLYLFCTETPLKLPDTNRYYE